MFSLMQLPKITAHSMNHLMRSAIPFGHKRFVAVVALEGAEISSHMYSANPFN